MKRFIPHTLLLAAALLTGGVRATAQMKTAYFMEGSVQRLDLNAALVPQRGYAAIPGMGNVGVEANSNFLSVRNFLYPAPDGDGLVTFLHGSVGNREFLRRMRRNNHLEINVRENLLGFGGYARRYFWSFGLNLRSESSINLPKDLFSLLKRLEPGQYDLKGTDINSDNYLEMAMGFAFPIRILTKEVTIGFRAKGLLGLAHASVHIDGMDIDLNDREWRADLRGSVNANVAGMNFSDLRGRIELQDVMDRLDPSDIDLNRIGSWGLAFDLGAETRFLDDRLKVSLGLNDLGFVCWSKKCGVGGTLSDLSFAYSGYDFDREELSTSTPDEIMLDIAPARNRTRMLKATLNVGGEYNILDERIGFGLLWHTRFASSFTSTELTASANFRPSPWFTASLSHSLLQNRLGVFGFALNVHPSWINFFLGMDYIGLRYGKYSDIATIPIGMKAINLHFGLSVPITKPKADGFKAATRARLHRRR